MPCRDRGTRLDTPHGGVGTSGEPIWYDWTAIGGVEADGSLWRGAAPPGSWLASNKEEEEGSRQMAYIGGVDAMGYIREVTESQAVFGNS